MARARNRLDFASDGRDWPHREASLFVEAGGLTWHAQRMGAGLPVLLLHGTGATTHSWRALAPLLAQAGCDVLAPDLPGHGFSGPLPRPPSLPAMAQAVAALLDQVGFRPALAVGHSAGAAIIVEMRLDGLLDPRGVVAINGAFLPFGGVAGKLFSPLAKLLAANPLAAHLFSAGSAQARAERLIRSTGSRIDEAGLALYARALGSPGHVAGALAMMANWDLAALSRRLPALATPIQLIVGESDRAVPPRDAARVRALVGSGARSPAVTHLPGLGHLAHEERPDIVAKHILGFARALDLTQAREA